VFKESEAASDLVVLALVRLVASHADLYASERHAGSSLAFRGCGVKT